MLVPATLYSEEIRRQLMQRSYDEEMLYYTGCLGSSIPTISSDNSDGTHYQFAIIDNIIGDRLIGYFTYSIDWYSSCAGRFGLYSFDKGNRVIGLDVYRELKKLINEYHMHRIEWRMVGGNPVEKHYDKFCAKYHGKKFVLTDAIKDKHGNYHNDVIYEIILKGR